MAVVLDALVVDEGPAPWRAAGFDVHGASDGTGFLSLAGVDGGIVSIGCAGDGAGHDRWALRVDGAAHLGTVDGIGAVRVGPAVTSGPHPNGAVSLDHVVVRSPNLDRTTEAFGAIGLELRRTRDVPFGEVPMQQRFFRTENAILELVGPAAPTGNGPASLWGIAVVVDDIDASAASLGEHCSVPKDAVQPGRRIATVRTRELGIGLTIALMTPHRR